jgi:LysM repeat protein
MGERGYQIAAGIAAAAFMIITVAVAFLLSSQVQPSVKPYPSPTFSLTFPPPTLTSLPPSPIPTFSPTLLPTFTPTPYCLPPYGWTIYVVKPGDSLNSIAARYRTTVEALMYANCLTSTRLTQGQRLYVPPLPPTSTPVPPSPPVCIPPYGWRPYVVRPGDTLYSLAARFGTTVQAIMRANCLNRYYLYTGEIIYLPPYFTPTPTRRPTPTLTPTRTVTPTLTPTITVSPTLTLTPIPTELPTLTPMPTEAPTPAPTESPTLPPEPTSSPAPTPTESLTPSPAPTETITPTLTP